MPPLPAWSPASTTTAVAAATAAGALPLLLGTGLVDGQGSLHEVLAVEHRDRLLRLLVRAHLDEAEAPRLAGIGVRDDLYRRYSAGLPKQFLEVLIRCLERQVPHVKLCAHIISLSINLRLWEQPWMTDHDLPAPKQKTPANCLRQLSITPI